MLTTLKQQWIQLKHYPAGQRFLRRYEVRRQTEPRKSSLLRRLVIFGLAAILTVIGIILVFMPGPAILFFFLAGAVLAEESRTIARLLDWLELKIRRVVDWGLRWWSRRSMIARGMVLLTAATLTGAFAYLSYHILI